MHIEIIQNDGDLKRERWIFYLCIGISAQLFLDSYVFETRISRGNWKGRNWYYRIDKRNNTIDCPVVPQDIITAAKSKIHLAINELEITY